MLTGKQKWLIQFAVDYMTNLTGKEQWIDGCANNEEWVVNMMDERVFSCLGGELGDVWGDMSSLTDDIWGAGNVLALNNKVTELEARIKELEE